MISLWSIRPANDVTSDSTPLAAGGQGILALSDEKKTKRDGDAKDRGVNERDGRSNRDVGHALRSVYSTTVNEEIPSELLDLLGKLD